MVKKAPQAHADGQARPADPQVVFVVYGRDERVARGLFDFLRALGLKPTEWGEAIAATGTAAPYVGQVLDAAFERAQAVVVVLSPDEIAYLHPDLASGPGDTETDPSRQPRPNVLFEAGMALGRHPDRTVLVECGRVRAFSDIVGRHTVRLSDDLKARQDLANRLKTAGCQVVTTGVHWHDAGDLAPPDPDGDGLPLGRRVPSAATARRTVDFDAQWHSGGGNHGGRLQIINRGTEDAFDVEVTWPDTALLQTFGQQMKASRIPGRGKSVNLTAFDQRFGGDSVKETSFDLTITARTESGEQISQQVFLDVNG